MSLKSHSEVLLPLCCYLSVALKCRFFYKCCNEVILIVLRESVADILFFFVLRQNVDLLSCDKVMFDVLRLNVIL